MLNAHNTVYNKLLIMMTPSLPPPHHHSTSTNSRSPLEVSTLNKITP